MRRIQLVCSGDVPEGVEEKKYFFLVSLLNQIYWVIGSVMGSVLGECIEYQYGRDRFLDDSSVSGGIYGTVDEHEGSQKRRCRCCCIRDLSVDLWGISLSDPVDDLYHGDFDADAWE